jgi:hypothetical protein
MKTLGKIKLNLPAAASIQVVATAVPVAPVRVLKTFASFADEVDGYVPDVAPAVLQGHTVTYEVDPLPWD